MKESKATKEQMIIWVNWMVEGRVYAPAPAVAILEYLKRPWWKRIWS